MPLALYESTNLTSEVRANPPPSQEQQKRERRKSTFGTRSTAKFKPWAELVWPPQTKQTHQQLFLNFIFPLAPEGNTHTAHDFPLTNWAHLFSQSLTHHSPITLELGARKRLMLIQMLPKQLRPLSHFHVSSVSFKFSFWFWAHI